MSILQEQQQIERGLPGFLIAVLAAVLMLKSIMPATFLDVWRLRALKIAVKLGNS